MNNSLLRSWAALCEYRMYSKFCKALLIYGKSVIMRNQLLYCVLQHHQFWDNFELNEIVSYSLTIVSIIQQNQ